MCQKVNNNITHIPEVINDKGIQKINNEVLNYYQKSNNKEIKIDMAAVLIHVRDFLKTRGKTNEISEDLSTQQIQLSDVVECYNNSFAAVNNKFDDSQLVIPNQQTMMSRSKTQKKHQKNNIRLKFKKDSKINQNVHFVVWKKTHMTIVQQEVNFK